MAQIRDGLKAVEDEVGHDRLPGIASRLRAADDAFAALSFEALQAKDLAAFYDTAAGRAKLAVMNDVFRRRNDEDGHAVLMKLLEEAQKQQDQEIPHGTKPPR